MTVAELTRRDEGDVQAARREQALVQSNEETGRIGGGHHRDIQVRLLDDGRGGVPAAGKPGQEQDRQDGDGRDGAKYLRGPDCPREPTCHRRFLFPMVDRDIPGTDGRPDPAASFSRRSRFLSGPVRAGLGRALVTLRGCFRGRSEQHPELLSAGCTKNGAASCSERHRSADGYLNQPPTHHFGHLPAAEPPYQAGARLSIFRCFDGPGPGSKRFCALPVLVRNTVRHISVTTVMHRPDGGFTATT